MARRRRHDDDDEDDDYRPRRRREVVHVQSGPNSWQSFSRSAALGCVLLPVVLLIMAGVVFLCCGGLVMLNG